MPDRANGGGDAGERTFPLVPSAQKAGTTWLYYTLRVRPAIAMPTKEPHVFDRAFVPNLAAMRDGRQRERFASFRRGLAEQPDRRALWQRRIDLEERLIAAEQSLGDDPGIFLDHLQGRRGEWITGDMTPDYSLLTPAQWHVVRGMIDRIAARQRVLRLLRDPVDRVASEIRFSVPTGCEGGWPPGGDEWLRAFCAPPTVLGHTRYEAIAANLEREWAADERHVEFSERLFTQQAMARIAGMLWDRGGFRPRRQRNPPRPRDACRGVARPAGAAGRNVPLGERSLRRGHHSSPLAMGVAVAHLGCDQTRARTGGDRNRH